MRAVAIFVVALVLAVAVPATADDPPVRDLKVESLQLNGPWGGVFGELYIYATIRNEGTVPLGSGSTDVYLRACPASDHVQPPEQDYLFACRNIMVSSTGVLQPGDGSFHLATWNTNGYVGDWDICAFIADHNDDNPTNDILCKRAYLIVPWPGLGVGFHIL